SLCGRRTRARPAGSRRGTPGTSRVHPLEPRVAGSANQLSHEVRLPAREDPRDAELADRFFGGKDDLAVCVRPGERGPRLPGLRREDRELPPHEALVDLPYDRYSEVGETAGTFLHPPPGNLILSCRGGRACAG